MELNTHSFHHVMLELQVDYIMQEANTCEKYQTVPS